MATDATNNWRNRVTRQWQLQVACREDPLLGVLREPRTTGTPDAVEFAHQRVKLIARLARKAARGMSRSMVVERPAHGLIMPVVPVAVRFEVVLSVSHGCRHFQLAEARSNPLVQRAICPKIASNQRLLHTIARRFPSGLPTRASQPRAVPLRIHVAPSPRRDDGAGPPPPTSVPSTPRSSRIAFSFLSAR